MNKYQKYAYEQMFKQFVKLHREKDQRKKQLEYIKRKLNKPKNEW
jgi:hypothetical protein